MKTLCVLAIAAVATSLATGSPAYAQDGLLPQAPVMENGRSPGVAASPPIDDRAMRRRMESAERAWERGEVRAARRQYADLVDDLLSAGKLPTEAMWKLATTTYAVGNTLEAATVLDRLASVASMHGAIQVEALSLLEAARLYERVGKTEESVDRLNRGMALLPRPVRPLKIRATLQQGIA